MMEPSPTPETSRANATRARLLEAATEAFADKGFHGTTTRDIAARAGMSPAALYVHHRSKEELLYLISRLGHERTLALVVRASQGGGSPVERFSRAVRDFAIDHATQNTQARIVNYELAALSAEHLTEIRGFRRQIDAEVRSLVEEGVAAGSFDTPDPQVAAVAVLSLGIDLARWYQDGLAWSPEDIAAQYVEIALRIVGARG